MQKKKYHPLREWARLSPERIANVGQNTYLDCFPSLVMKKGMKTIKTCHFNYVSSHFGGPVEYSSLIRSKLQKGFCSTGMEFGVWRVFFFIFQTSLSKLVYLWAGIVVWSMCGGVLRGGNHLSHFHARCQALLALVINLWVGLKTLIKPEKNLQSFIRLTRW